MRKPTSVALTVNSEFRASHSLEGFETPHFHLWKLSMEFKTSLPLLQDRLIDLVYLQEELAELIAPLDGTFLNDSLGFSPTSENLAAYLWDGFLARNPTAPLHSVSVSLCDLSGRSTGTARVES